MNNFAVPIGQEAAATVVMFVGQVIVGACVSLTLTVNEQVAMLFEPSFVEQLTVVVPTAKSEPEAGAPIFTVPWHAEVLGIANALIRGGMFSAADWAGALGAEIRRRNLIRADEFPYRTPLGGVYDSGNYQAVLDRAVSLSQYQALRAEQARARAQPLT